MCEGKDEKDLERMFDREMLVDVIVEISGRYRLSLPAASYVLLEIAECIKGKHEDAACSVLLKIKLERFNQVARSESELYRRNLKF